MFLSPMDGIGFSAGNLAPPPAISSSYLANLYASVSSNTKTFSGASIGDADSKRKIVVTIIGENQTGRIVSSVTVAGVSCSLANPSPTSRLHSGVTTAEIWSTDSFITSGTTADIVITWDGTQTRYYVGTYRALNLGSPYDAFTSSASTPTGSINIPAGGAVFAHCHSSAGTNTYTWTGPTERFDANPISTITHSGASDDYATAQSGLTVTASPSGTMNAPALTCVSFSKA